MHSNPPRKPRQTAVRGFWKGEFRGQRVFDSTFGKPPLVGTMWTKFAALKLGGYSRDDQLFAEERSLGAVCGRRGAPA